jgi:hypothetical protein
MSERPVQLTYDVARVMPSVTFESGGTFIGSGAPLWRVDTDLSYLREIDPTWDPSAATVDGEFEIIPRNFSYRMDWAQFQIGAGTTWEIEMDMVYANLPIAIQIYTIFSQAGAFLQNNFNDATIEQMVRNVVGGNFSMLFIRTAGAGSLIYSMRMLGFPYGTAMAGGPP